MQIGATKTYNFNISSKSISADSDFPGLELLDVHRIFFFCTSKRFDIKWSDKIIFEFYGKAAVNCTVSSNHQVLHTSGFQGVCFRSEENSNQALPHFVRCFFFKGCWSFTFILSFIFSLIPLTLSGVMDKLGWPVLLLSLFGLSSQSVGKSRPDRICVFFIKRGGGRRQRLTYYYM